MIDSLYTNGAIAVKEKELLKEKIFRFAELSKEEAIKAVLESGFGGGTFSDDPELLCAAEEKELDEFIRTYAPSSKELIYLFAPRDFHNLKALFKAKILNLSPEKMLSPEGLYSIEDLSLSLEGERKTLPLNLSLLEKAKSFDGKKIGMLFERMQQAYLLSHVGRGILRRFLIEKTDRRNLLFAERSESFEELKENFLEGGARSLKQIWEIKEGKKKEDLFFGKERGFWAREREIDSFEAETFYLKRYDLTGKEPFLYYVFRRRREIGNVRTLLVLLGAGYSEQEIKRRLNLG